MVHVNGACCDTQQYIPPCKSSENFALQTSHTWAFSLPTEIIATPEISVRINEFEFTAVSVDSILQSDEPVDLAACTVFKYDYKNVRIYIDYYNKYHKIKTYFMYYNGNAADIAADIIVPDDCMVILFSVDHPYWQKFCTAHTFNGSWPWAHSVQSIQLTHSSIIANTWCKALINVDLDEYVHPVIDIRKLLTEADCAYLQYFSVAETCGGTLCKRDYDYDYTEILGAIQKGRSPNSNQKFVQKTLGREIYNRGVHDSTITEARIKLKCLYHLKCVSYTGDGIKRCCV